MKKISLLIIILLINAYCLNSQDQDRVKLDKSKKPEPEEIKEFVFPDYATDKLSNGAKLFMLKDDEQPIITIRIMIPGGSALDGDKPGLAGLVADMLLKGSGELDAMAFAESVDFLGASINTNSSSDYMTVEAKFLKKHTAKLLDLLIDVITAPKFDKDEFAKLINQRLSGLKYQKSNPNSLAGNLARKVVFGELHPYGKYATEESIKSITLDDVKDYYKSIIKPGLSSVMVYGDFDEKSIKSTLNKTFDKWAKGNSSMPQIAEPNSMPVGVYFISRPGSVQSSVYVYFKAVPFNNENYELMSLSTTVMSGYFGSRLFRTLRETYSYTYSPTSSITSNRFANAFLCGAEVRNSVTDSALKVIMDQLQNYTEEPAKFEEINRVKKYRVGRFLTSFENISYVANIIQLADFMGVPIERYKELPKRVSTYEPYDFQKVAERYFNTLGAFIIVVGSPEVKDKLTKFGKIYEYNTDLKPISGENAELEKVSMSAKDLIEKNVEATGGQDAINKVKSLKVDSKLTFAVQGQEFQGTMTQLYQTPNKMYLNISSALTKQERWVDGKSSWSKGVTELTEDSGAELEKALFNATLFNFTKLIDMNFKCEVKGKQNGMILLKAVSPSGDSYVYYLDANTYLIKKIESDIKSAQGTMPITESYIDYVTVDGVKFVSKAENSNPYYSVKFEFSYSLNPAVNEDMFKPKK